MDNDASKRIDKKLALKQDHLRELKNLKRHQKKCLKCASRDHLLSDCPQTKASFCYKCGSQEHSHKECEQAEYKLADCFYCGKKGHIARECPQNERGLYIKGGSCFGCGSVRHILKDCPNNPRNVQKVGTFKNTE